ncbi:phage tail terminator family protein [Geomicrobium sediminis]|uniref:Phage protein n=1 Tax=Geomicrobium sediminis TaxID=1347788 RepID=A0ABS2P6S5_9BACL|nr:hypothetical protein [Geomicrobium sediminis]MBM7631102.1 hypothetical protein [Geomicrobium sediminis]
MKLITIQRAVISQLVEKFGYTVYGEEVGTGFKRPSFFVYLVPLETRNLTYYELDKAVMVKIDYYSRDETRAEHWMMADELESLFNKSLKVDNRYLNIERSTKEEIEGVLSFGFTVEYTVAIDRRDVDLGYGDGKDRNMEILEMEWSDPNGTSRN